ncbi:tRNA-intron lyase [Candidatus Micrarchaeota archaeon]|nr:tRNA-intron lyase [Candidatus Micrarchaeota archaeon]
MVDMPLEIIFDPERKRFTVEQPESVSSLLRTAYGRLVKGKILLQPEEALFILDARNGRCIDKKGNLYKITDLLPLFSRRKRFITRYLAYKGWRDRGLIARPVNECKGPYNRNPVKKYPEGRIDLSGYEIKGLFSRDGMYTVCENDEDTKELYYKYWFGQYGTYKAEKRGSTTKYDIFETVFLTKKGVLDTGYSAEEIIEIATKKNRFFEMMYNVYEDWREHGYVLKTGFKFGTHFRLYFPGASPGRKGKEWIHSKHVVHVFPTNKRLSIPEWARAVRVAHSVRKTFIQAIPGKLKREDVTLDYLLYHRKKGGIEIPGEDKPKYLMLALNEEDHITGRMLSNAIEVCKREGLQLLLSICDRETAITYYLVKRIEIPNSNHEYYEIEWVLP